MQNVDENYGIVANNVNASSVAVGANAQVINEIVPFQATLEIDRLRLMLLEFIEKTSGEAREVAEAKRAAETAAANLQSNNRQTIIGSLQNVVATFKMLGETVVATNKIVDVATTVMARL